MQNRKRLGFTLIELMVVIAIIGILIALILPAVQAAREAARRLQCSNNLKQIALGLHLYHDAYKCFPFGHSRFATNNAPGEGFESFRGGPLFAILPFVEQSALYEQGRLAASYGIYPNASILSTNEFLDNGNPNPWKMVPDLFLCPSEVGPRQYRLFNKSSGYNVQTNYLMSVGDWPDLHSSDKNTRGIFMLGRPDRGTGKVRTVADILDGVSNTILYGEKCHGSGDRQLVKVGIAEVTTSFSSEDNFFETASAKECVASRNSIFYHSSVSMILDQAGYAWADGGCSQRCTITTCLPPNAPSCFSGRNNANYRTIMSPSSYHPCGANIARCDGSIIFVSETINAGLASASTRADGSPIWQQSGKSHFGVWGALGSINGGESVTLP